MIEFRTRWGDALMDPNTPPVGRRATDGTNNSATVAIYVAAVIVMAFDEQGQATDAPRKLEICHRAYRILTEEAGFPPEQLDGTWKPYGPVGCERCNGGGYKGRVGIYQIMPITPAIESIILAHGNSMEIAAKSEEEGVKSLRQSGLVKVKNGLTSLEEVLGCTNE